MSNSGTYDDWKPTQKAHVSRLAKCHGMKKNSMQRSTPRLLSSEYWRLNAPTFFIIRTSSAMVTTRLRAGCCRCVVSVCVFASFPLHCFPPAPSDLHHAFMTYKRYFKTLNMVCVCRKGDIRLPNYGTVVVALSAGVGHDSDNQHANVEDNGEDGSINWHADS